MSLGDRTILGMLTPSSNTVLEPYASAMIAPLVPKVSIHFARFPVTEISLNPGSLAQFENEKLLEAARLLADAKAQVIAWNGTSGGWKGLAADEELCRVIEQETGAKATTSTLALIDAFDAIGARRIALATPYLDEIQSKIIDTFEASGLSCCGEDHLGDPGNFSFSDYSEDEIADQVRDLARTGPDAIAVYCTNFRGAPLAESLEEELGIPIIDSVAVTVWRALALAGQDPSQIEGWGSIYSAKI